MATDGQTDYPNLNPFEGNNRGSADTQQMKSDANGTYQNAKSSVYNNAQAAMDKVSNHPVTQDLANGPVAQKGREEIGKTQNEFSNLANSRVVPDQKTATGQELTHYHSMFYNLLSWENPRATTISYATIVVFIFFTRYVPVLKYVFKGLYVVLGITAASEIAGRVIFQNGLASQMRPRKYYTFPKSALESATDDIAQLINFFVIEFQRIVFAENIYATISAFAAALIGYFLVKFVPKWGLALVATTVVYFVPLIYIRNRELIDRNLEHAGEIINQQTQQARELANYHTHRAVEATKSTANTYSAKAQEMMGSAKTQAQNRASSPSAPNPANTNPFKNEPEREIKQEDFPSAPNPGNMNPFKNEPERNFQREDFPSAPYAEPSRFETTQAEYGRAEPSGFETTQAEYGRAEPSEFETTQAEYRRAGPILE